MIRFKDVTMMHNFDAPGGETTAFIAESKGYILWQDERSGGFWVKKRGHCKFVGPTMVRDATPYEEDIPKSPKEIEEAAAKKAARAKPSTEPTPAA